MTPSRDPEIPMIEPNAPPKGRARLWPHQLRFPLEPSQVFGRRAPLAVEIGFGNGAFLADVAARQSEWDYLGVEIAAASISRGVQRAHREGVENVKLFCGDGRTLVWDVLPPRSLRRIIVNFPDPWPKERHHARRLLQREFFELASTRLEDGGSLWLTTDHEEYFRFALEEAAASRLFRSRVGEPPPETLLTKYAEKWQSRDLAIHHVAFEKVATSDREFLPRIEEVEMAHARLRGDFDSVRDFDKEVYEIDGGHVVLLELSRGLDGRRLIFQVVVEEADLRQNVLVEARQSRSGVYVGLERFGAPVQSRGVRAAVLKVADWLVDRGFEVLERAD